MLWQVHIKIDKYCLIENIMNIFIRFVDYLFLESQCQDLLFIDKLLFELHLISFFDGCTINDFSQITHITSHDSLQQRENCVHKNNEPWCQAIPLIEIKKVKEPFANFLFIRFNNRKGIKGIDGYSLWVVVMSYKWKHRLICQFELWRQG